MYLQRLINILETVATAGKPLSVKEISNATMIPKPSCYKLIQDLVKVTLLSKDSEKNLFLSDRLTQLVKMNQQDPDLIAIAEPLMKKSANKFGASFFLSRLRQTGVEIISVETPINNRVSFLHPGLGFRPLHACSCAKAIAAFSAEKFQLGIIHSRLKSYTRNTRTNATLLRAEFKSIRAKGYAECVQEIEVGVCSVAAPVFVQDLGVLLSLGATGPMRLFTNEFRTKLGSYLTELSEDLSGLLNSRDVWRNGTIALAS